MGDMGVKGIKDLKKLQEKLEKFGSDGKHEMFEYIVKQVSMRFLSRVIQNTPVMTGRLRRGWIGENTPGTSPNVSDQHKFIEATPVKQNGKSYQMTISNNVHYAPYVEYGHRQHPGQYVPVLGKSLVRDWVPGSYMLKRATKEVEPMLPGLVEKLADQFTAKYFK